MIPRIAWIFALTVFTVSAQQQGDRLWIGNAAGVGEPGKIAPGSLAQYSITFEQSPPLLPFETPTLSLRYGNGPSTPLDLAEGTPFSGKVYIPDEAQPGPATITLHTDTYRVSADIEIVPSSAALYAIDFSRVLNAQTAPDARPVQLTSPARPGDVLTLWGTGLGTATTADIEATIGDQPFQILYAGHSSQYRGLDQYNLAVPAGATLPDTCYARLDLKVRGTATPVGYLPTSQRATGPCRHPLNLTTAEMTALDQGGAIPLATFSLSSSVSPANEESQVNFTRLERREAATATVVNADASAIALSSNSFLRDNRPRQCAILTGGGITGWLSSGGSQEVPPPSLGDKVRLDGPAQSYDLILPPDERWFISSTYTANLPVAGPVRYYDQLPASRWTPGNYTFSGTGDSSLEAFRLDTEIPGALRLRNPESFRTIDRTRDLTVAWNTERMQPGDVLDIGLSSRASTALAYLSCTVRALDGTVTIPSNLLQQLPAAEVSPQQSPILSFGYLRPRTVQHLPRRNADPVPTFVDWSDYAIIPTTLR